MDRIKSKGHLVLTQHALEATNTYNYDMNFSLSMYLDGLHNSGSGCCQNNSSMEWSHNNTELEQDNESLFRVAYWIVSALFQVCSHSPGHGILHCKV
jgi:hypothetical protein